MAKIPEYSRSQFASTYVGAPAEDTSGSTAVAGIGQAVAPTIEAGVKIIEDRNAVQIDQQANNALIRYSIDYQQRAKELEKQYASNPDGYAGAVATMGMELQTSYSENIADERIRARFGSAANTVIRQSSASALQWAETKKEENAYVAYDDSLALSAQLMGNQTTLDGLKSNAKALVTLGGSNTLLSPEKQRVLTEKHLEDGFSSYAYNMATDNPEILIDQIDDMKSKLDTGDTSGLTFTDAAGNTRMLPVTGEKLAKYREMAVKQLENIKEKRDLDRVIRANGEGRKIIDGFNNGTVRLADAAIYQDRTLNDPNATEDEKAMAKTAYQFVLDGHRKTGVIDETKGMGLYARADALSKKIGKKPPRQNYSELLKIQVDATQLRNDGTISIQTYGNIMKKVLPGIEKGIQKGSYDRANRKQYETINAKIANMPGLTLTQKKEAMLKAHDAYITSLMEAELMPDQKISQAAKAEMAEKAVQDVTMTYYPETAASGNPNAVASAAKGSTIITTDPISEKLRTSGKRVADKKPPPVGTVSYVKGVLSIATEQGWKPIPIPENK